MSTLAQFLAGCFWALAGVALQDAPAPKPPPPQAAPQDHAANHAASHAEDHAENHAENHAANQQADHAEKEPPPRVSVEQVRAAGAVIGLAFTDDELSLMLHGVSESLGNLEKLREAPLANSEPPALGFSPLLPGLRARPQPWRPGLSADRGVARPANLEDLAFADIDTLSSLIKSRKVSCEELARMFLARLHRLDDSLHCVITFTEERALQQAQELDRELADGRWRGPLHGIPWGAKDLLAVRGYRTTWGSKPFEEQVIDADAEVVRRLDAAGAVLLAKLTLGELAWGDVWFGGKTRNPWNPEQGSSGSSAGPAAATAAGGVVFAIGSETLGSIVSPSARCGCSSLRPTFGRVSRAGAMTLSWSMDKLGPMARSARDCALVLASIAGEDPADEATLCPRAAPEFGAPAACAAVQATDTKGWRVGYVPESFGDDVAERSALDELKALGVELVPVKLPQAPLGDMLVILSAEAAEAFDRLTLDGQDDLMARQVDQAWPNVFRCSRLIPAVEYLRAQRVRRQLMLAMDEVMAGVDVLVHSSEDDRPLIVGNLTGHPTFVAPCGFRDDGTPRSISFTGRLFDEARLLAFAEAWQGSTDWHRKHPGG
jgi:Asp-tRNA(Asn)/Glu-tRNA(Gln) amidotransferase A subunit family amidase